MKLKYKLFLLLKIVNLLNAVTLDCHEEHINLPGILGIFSCVVNGNLTVNNDDEEFSNITGIKNNTIIRGFMAEQKEIHYIPRNIATYLPELMNFMIKNSRLKEVTSRNLQEFPKLIFLDLSYNHIKILEKDVFQYNHNLKNIRLNNNLIFAIESGAFNMFNTNGILTSLNLYGNECQFLSAGLRKDVLTVIGNMEVRCWNKTSIKFFESYKVQSRFEKLEARIVNQKENLKKSNENFVKLQNQMVSLQDDLQENNRTLLRSLQDLNDTISKRIKRNAEEINKTVYESYNKIQENLEQITGKQTIILNKILSKVHNISNKVEKIDKLENKLDKMEQKLSLNINSHDADIKSLSFKLSSFLSKLQALNTDSKLVISYCATNDSSFNLSSITMEHLNTVLLLIIIAFQAINLCCKSRPKPKANKIKSRSFTEPPSLEPVYYTTATQLVDDNPKGSRRQKHYESYADIQSYDFVSTSEKQNSSNEVITTVQAEVEHQGFSNEIYETVTASSEDLYSEVISPKRLESKEGLNDDSAIYAVIEKRKEGDGGMF